MIDGLGASNEECLIQLIFDDDGSLVQKSEISSGAGSLISGRFHSLFANIFLTGCNAFALVHNHPSGDPTPSRWDLNANKRIGAVSAILDIEFLDHVIVTSEEALSMRANGYL